MGYSMGGRLALEIVSEEGNPYKAVVLLSAAANPGEESIAGILPEGTSIEDAIASAEELRAVIADLEERLSAEKQDREDVEEFIRRLKKYVDVQTLTRELGLELIEYVTVGAYTPNEPREINIYYKFLDKPLNDKKTLYSDENA